MLNIYPVSSFKPARQKSPPVLSGHTQAKKPYFGEQTATLEPSVNDLRLPLNYWDFIKGLSHIDEGLSQFTTVHDTYARELVHNRPFMKGYAKNTFQALKAFAQAQGTVLSDHTQVGKIFLSALFGPDSRRFSDFAKTRNATAGIYLAKRLICDAALEVLSPEERLHLVNYLQGQANDEGKQGVRHQHFVELLTAETSTK